ncbi:LamG-like jellyroll fold domain-containing protein [Prosthecobacter sp.]|uniref:LamG-like jellyroll fold domain-containing protein n=1 Tax=Prosthecobacter sp. TaxID=1965333 RepID=UPI003783DF24
MKSNLGLLFTFLVVAFVNASGLTLQDPWEKSYSNGDATGMHVMGCWKFDELPLSDASGRGGGLVLQGASATSGGRFGGGLSCGVNDGARHAAVVATPMAGHSPVGAFSAEMWVRKAAEAIETKAACLLDKQAGRMEDFQWSLLPANERGMRQMNVRLGFGMYAKDFASAPVWLPVGEWVHLAFTYDGAGKVTFFANSQKAGEVFVERCGATQSGSQALCIGDSSNGGMSFPGDLDEVRLCIGERGFAAFSLEIISACNVWERGARALPMKISCTNLQRQPLIGANMTFIACGIEQTFIFPDLEPGATNVNEFGPDTLVKPGDYVLEVVMGKGHARVSAFKEFQITARRPQLMPVIIEGADVTDLPRLKALACTHWTGLTNDDAPYLGTANKQRPAIVQPRLSAGTASGLQAVAALDHEPAMLGRGLRRVGRQGMAYVPPILDSSNPNAAGFIGAAGNMFTIYYRDFTSWTGTWLKAPSRARTRPGFAPVDNDAYFKFSKQQVPPEIQEEMPDWRKIAGFPADRVVPDDHPVLNYYRWFWSEGNGWKWFGDAWNRAYERRKQARPDTWLLQDHSVSQPAISGAHSTVRYIADGSMDTREPCLTGLCMDQQLAMSAAHETQPGVFGVVPLGWDRGLVVPPAAADKAQSILHSDRVSLARRITQAPALLKENVWMALSRPVKGIIFTDWPALRAANLDEMKSTRSSTHPLAYEALRDLAAELLFPLGPMLARRQIWRSEVVLLESFSSQIFAGRGLYRGASPRSLAAWKALQRAHVQTDLIYEETLLKGGLDGRKVLILTDCDVLTRSVVDAVQKWQKNGGKVIGDEVLCPALKADALVQMDDTSRSRGAEVITSATVVEQPSAAAGSVSGDNESLSERLASVCKEFGCESPVSCDNPDVLLHTSQTGEAACVFVMNDRREPGTYVGQHGLVKEAPLPSITTLGIGKDSVNVYDLTRSTFMLPKRDDSGLTISLKLGPAEGRVLLLSKAPLLEIGLDLPETATRGNVAEARVTLNTSGGNPMPAAIPVRVSIRDADGAPAELDGYHVVENGTLVLRLDMALNETPGTWEVRVRELASGMEAVKWMQVNP